MIISSLILGLATSPVEAPSSDHRLRAGDDAPTLAIRAERIELGDGSAIEDGVLVVGGGRILSVGSGEAPEGVALVSHAGVISPGIVACRTYGGIAGGKVDSTRALLAGARVVDAFDPANAHLGAALRAGITVAVLAPAPTTIAGGQTCVVKTHGGSVLSPSAHLALGLGSGALDRSLLPTSYQSAVRALDERFAGGEGAYGRAVNGQLPVLIDAPSRHQVERACALARRHGLRGALRGASLGGEILEEIQQSGLSVVLGPFSPGVARRTMNSVAALAEGGVPLGFALDGPGTAPEGLRLSAALSVRGGVSREVAVRGLFAEGARIAGVEGRAGLLAAGRDADFVLWSGDPLDLRSRVQAVFMEGEPVHESDDDDEGDDE